MQHSLFDIIQGTPLWVWGAFIYLLIIGLLASKTRTVSLYRLVIMPIIFTLWSLSSIHTKYACSSLSFAFWLTAFITGIIFAIHALHKKVIKVDHKHKLVTLSGDYTQLLLVMLFFIVKYSIGASYALNPSLKTTTLFLGIDMIASGIISGIAWGRSINIIKTYCKTPSLE